MGTEGRHLVNVRIASDLAVVVRLGALTVDDATIVERLPALDESLAEVARLARERPSGDPAAVRAMYRQLGLDPTKTRPSSEALLRRVRRGESVPRINALVDICNWCSLERQLPYGLYDLEAIEGDVELRRGRLDEQYAGIRKDVVHLAGRATLADARGPFGNPTSDSARTMVTPATTRALIVVFAPRAIDPDRLADVLQVTASRVTRFLGARETSRFVV